MAHPIIHKYLKPIVYGGMDGSVTTFAVVTASAGAGFSMAVILILGFANAFADGFSMAVGSYLSEKTEHEKGTTFFGTYDKYAFRTALATLISFVVVGSIPLLPYVYGYLQGLDPQSVFFTSIWFTIFAFGIVGYVRGKILRANEIVTTLESIVLGMIAAGISYLVGSWLEGIVR